MKRLLFLILLIITCNSGSGQEDNYSDDYTDSLFGNRKEIYFTFQYDDINLINNYLTTIISIDRLSGGQAWAYANKREFQNFLKENIDYNILPAPSSLCSNPRMYNGSNKEVLAWDFYPTYSQYENMMAAFESSYPFLCNIDTVLDNTMGNHRILIARISDNVNTAENEPRILFTSSIHGDELTGYILCLRFIDFLLSNYASNSRIANIVNNAEIWICPLANPDGTYFGGDNTVSGAMRYNLNGIDLNRNYPDPKSGLHPDGNSWQSETEAFMELANNYQFNLAINFHGGAELINYPWDTWTSAQNTHPDNDWWLDVCREYADTVHLYAPPSYFTDENNGVTEGGDWYVIEGGRQDFMNYYHYCREVTNEISVVKTPDASSLPLYWNYNIHSWLLFAEEGLYGIRGVVTDSCSGLPLIALVYISGYDRDSSHVYSCLPIGNYYRYLHPGTYNLTYSAPGYKDVTINNIEVLNSVPTVVNVELAPESIPVADFVANTTYSCSNTIYFSDLSNGSSNWLWNFGDGYATNQQNPAHTYSSSGNYTVSLIVSNCMGSDSIVKSSYITINSPDDPIVTSDTNCGQGALSLSAIGNGLIVWYDAISGGNIVDTGNIFNTPVLTASTTYYVENYIAGASVFGGKADNSGAGGYYTSTGEHALYFDCVEACKLVSVKVYAGSQATRTITLFNSFNQVIYDTNILIQSGESRLYLNWDIPAGTNMRLGCSGSPNLFRNGAPAGPNLGYPFDIDNKISITKSTASTPNEYSYYYYFYDWEIQAEGCSSERFAVNAVIINDAVAQFSYNINDSLVNFINQSQNATEYLWDFGDASTSAAIDPTHVYNEYNDYYVTLIALNTCGTDTTTILISINNISEIFDDFLVDIFPNPCLSSFYIRFYEPNNNFIEIYDEAGKKINDYLSYKLVSDNIIKILLPGNMSGLIIVKILSGDKKIVKKIIIQGK